MEKRLIIAIALSIAIILGFQFLAPKPQQAQVQPQTQAQTFSQQKTTSAASQSIGVKQKTAKEKETLVETNRYVLVFTNLGGSLKEIRLKEYIDAQTQLPAALVSSLSPEHAVLSLSSEALITNLKLREFTLKTKNQNRVIYTFDASGKFSITKEYTFSKFNDCIELRIIIENKSGSVIYKDYELTGSSALEPAGLTMGRNFLENVAMLNGKLTKWSRVKDQKMLAKGIVSWVGQRERYFCMILKPHQELEGVTIARIGKKIFTTGVKTNQVPIYQNTSVTDQYTLYAGPNDEKRLSAVGMQGVVSYGIFGPITKVLLVVLKSFNKVVHNWGLSIIMLTFLINLVLLPLTRKSFSSMRKMQEVQPHIEKLRKLHKDNPQKMNKELAEVYRQYKVNPFGGCLPLLLQMPIFIALYQGLMKSVELKGAHFLWIKDLSSPDFVTLPFTLPFIGNQIHILPILTAIAMLMQQKSSMQSMSTGSPEQKQQQKFMMVFFPLFFGFLFYNFPAGLVLYWLTNTVLMVIEHATMRKAKL